MKSKFKCKWKAEDMENAVKACKEGTSVRKAAEKFHVPKSSLQDIISGKNKIGSRVGRKPVFKPHEEKELVEWLKKMSRLGFGRTKKQVVETVQNILDKQGRTVPVFKNNKPGDDWWKHFLRRNPEIRMKKPEKLERFRAKSCSEKGLRGWYDHYEKVLKEFGITSADQVYNCDESGFPLQAGTIGKVVVERGVSHAYQIASNKKTQITVLVAISADERALNPAVLFPGKRPIWNYSIDLPHNSMVAFTDNGWMETGTFYAWLANHFVKEIPSKRPVILLLDGHDSHVDLYVSNFCDENGIILFCLRQHTSHLTQPLDVGFFKPLKTFWSAACQKFNDANPKADISKATFGRVFMEAFNKAVKRETIINSFEKAGIYPCNFDQLDKSKFTCSELYDNENDGDDGDVDIAGISKIDDNIILEIFEQNEETAPRNEEPGPPHREDQQQPHSLSAMVKDALSSAKRNIESAIMETEKNMTTEKIDVFEKRFREGYDLQEDAEYCAWRDLKVLASNPTPSPSVIDKSIDSECQEELQKEQEPLPGPSTVDMTDVSSSVGGSESWKHYLSYPGTPKKTKNKEKNLRQKSSMLPRHLSGRLAQEMMASIKKKKKEEQDAKEKRKEGREKKAAEKKRRAAEKKKQTQLKKKQREEQKAAKECERAKKNSKGKKGKKKLFEQLLREENECQKCGGVYDSDDEDERWIACGKDVESDEESEFDNGCGLWFHVRCTYLGQSITDEELEEINWLCETCI